METPVQYLTRMKAELSVEDYNALSAAHIDRFIGIKPNTGGGGCTSDNCHGTTGCTQATPNGDCGCVGGGCVWISDLGK